MFFSREISKLFFFNFPIKIGFSNVNTHYERSPMTMDYRMDRVRVIVNAKGIVTSVPSIA